MSKPQEVPLDSVQTDHEYQCRVTVDRATVKEYVMIAQEAEENGDPWPFPPITMVNQWCVDGFHRVAAARLLGRATIPAIRLEGGQEAARQQAVQANASHGRRRSNADKRRAVELAMQWWPGIANRELAKRCGVSYQLVNIMKREAEQSHLASDSDSDSHTEATKEAPSTTHLANDQDGSPDGPPAPPEDEGATAPDSTEGDNNVTPKPACDSSVDAASSPPTPEDPSAVDSTDGGNIATPQAAGDGSPDAASSPPTHEDPCAPDSTEGDNIVTPQDPSAVHARDGVLETEGQHQDGRRPSDASESLEGCGRTPAGSDGADSENRHQAAPEDADQVRRDVDDPSVLASAACKCVTTLSDYVERLRPQISPDDLKVAREHLGELVAFCDKWQTDLGAAG